MQTDSEKKYKQELKKAMPALQKAALGDFSSRIKVSDEENIFTEIFVSINLMLDDLTEMKRDNERHEKELKKLNQSLERRVAEKIKLSIDSGLRYKKLMENMPSGVAVYEVKNNGADFIFKDYNAAGRKMDNVKGKSVIGKNVKDVFPGVEKMGLYKAMRRVWKTGKPESLPISNYQDEKLKAWRENYVYKLPSGEIVAIYTDETERRMIEEEVKQSESFLNQIIEQSPFSTWISDANGVNIRQNQACRDLFGIKNDSEVIDKYSLFKDNLLKKAGLMPQIKSVFTKGKIANFVVDYPFEAVKHVKVPGAKNVIIDVAIFPIKNAKGEVTNAVIQHRDITEKRAYEEKLRESEERYELAMRGTNDGLWDWNIKTNKVYYSPMWKKQLGYKDEEVSDSFDEFASRIHMDDAVRVDKYVKKFLAENGKTKFQSEFRMKHKNGGWVDVLARAFTLLDEKGKVERLIGTHVDITQQKILEREHKTQINSLQKMNEIMVDRELRMVALKEELKKYKSMTS